MNAGVTPPIDESPGSVAALPLPVALLVEQGIAAALALDPDTRQRLRALDGAVIRVQVEVPNVELLLIVNAGRVTVPTRHDAPADLDVVGSLAALRSLRSGNDALHRGEVRVTGDAALARTLRELLARFDPDWQGALSPLAGDALVHRLDRFASSAAQWLAGARGSLRESGRDWLEDEVAVVATPDEVQQFVAAVDTARSTADRLEARLVRLERAAAQADNP